MRWSKQKQSGTERTQTRYEAYCLFYHWIDSSVGSAREQHYYINRPQQRQPTIDECIAGVFGRENEDIEHRRGGIMYSTCRRRRSNYTDCTLVPTKVSGITTKRNHGNLCFLCRMPFHHDRKNIGSGWRSFYFWKKILVGFITTVVVITFGSFI